MSLVSLPNLFVVFFCICAVNGQNVTNCISEDAASSSFEVPPPFNYILIALLICLSALFSGLTLGLLGLDVIGLEIIMGGDNDALKKAAKAIYPIRLKGNWLLCTLLLGNVATNALLSIIMADMTSGLVGFLSSTIMIVIFGEIIPQATCSRYALQIGQKSLPIVKVFMALLLIVAYPLSLVLDYILGEEVGTVHTRTELLTMLKIHERHEQLDKDTVDVMSGAITYRDKIVNQVMTPIDRVFMIHIDEKFGYKTLSDVFKSGFSRIPIYGRDRSDIVGVMLAKDLIFIDPEDETPVRNFISLFGRPHIRVWSDDNLGKVLSELKQARVHLAFAQEVKDNGMLDNTYEVVGIITLEDIIEEILGDIEDETDAQCGDEDGTIGSSAARDRELARLIMLTGKISQEKLSIEEIQAISSHLISNVPQLRPLFESSSVTVEGVQRMVTRCKVMELRRVSTSDMVNSRTPASEDTLFRRGKLANACCLVLSGRVAVLAGKDEFYSELGPWSLVGSDAVKLEDGTYLPDFTSYIVTESVRCLWITKSDVAELLEGKPSSVIGLRPPKRKTKLGKDENIASLPAPEPTKYDRNASKKSSEDKREETNPSDTRVQTSPSNGPLQSILQGFVPPTAKYKSLDEQSDDLVTTHDIENGIQLKTGARSSSNRVADT